MILDRNLAADWTQDLVVPNPGQPVKASVQPGAVDPGFQGLYSRQFDVLRGVVSYGHLSINAGAPEATAAVVPPAVNDRGIRAVAVGGGFLSFSAGGLLLSNAGSTNQVQINEFQVSSTTENFRLDINGLFTTGAGGTARYRQTGVAYTGVANPGRTSNSANEVRPALACKAWGNVLAGNGTITTQDGEGGWAASIVADRVRITLTQALLDTVYTVNVLPIGNGGDFTAQEDYNARTASTFDLVFKVGGVERTAANASGIGFQFSLFGRR